MRARAERGTVDGSPRFNCWIAMRAVAFAVTLRRCHLRIQRFVFVLLPILVAASTLGGETPYKGAGPANPQPQPAHAAPPQDYSYYCWARTLDGTTEYRTDVMAEPAPHNAAFIGEASQAWAGHLAQTVGKNKTVGECYDGPTATAKPAWEKGWSQPGSKKPVHVDWHFG
jgi:hypothetical protein